MNIREITDFLRIPFEVHNPEAMMEDLAKSNSYMTYIGEQLALSESAYRKERDTVGQLDDIKVLPGDKYKTRVDALTRGERAHRDNLEMTFKALNSRIESLRTTISVRKTELEKMERR